MIRKLLWWDHHYMPYFKLYMQPPQLPTLYININITILKMVKRAFCWQEVPVCLVAMGK